MKVPLVSICRLRRRNTLISLVGIAACCLIILTFKANWSSKVSSSSVRQKPVESSSDAFQSLSSKHQKIKIGLYSKDYQKEEHKDRETTSAKQTVPRYTFLKRDKTLKPIWNDKLFYNDSSAPKEFLLWRRDREILCEGLFVGYEHEFVEQKDVIINRKFCVCNLKGGELIQNVINQDELSEYYTYEMGCFQQRCQKRPSYFFNGENHLTKWMYSLQTNDVSDDVDRVINDFTIAVTRYEYANLFHTMTDWYNTFLAMQFFNHTSFNTNILIIDSHPYGALDSVWNQLFNSTLRLSSLPERTRFKNLIWGIMGYNSFMKIYVSPNPPLFEAFREFFLSAFQLNSKRSLDCKKLSILFIWRHNYVAHPRNPSGFVSRKIRNEDQLIRYIKRRNVNAVVKGVQIDGYSIKDQLKMVTDADILIGMHGAGLTHAVFLQKESALIELVPNYWSPMAEHFKAICVWRGIIYKQWFNNDPRNEFTDQSTNIPPQIMNTLIKNTIRELCVHQRA